MSTRDELYWLQTEYGAAWRIRRTPRLWIATARTPGVEPTLIEKPPPHSRNACVTPTRLLGVRWHRNPDETPREGVARRTPRRPCRPGGFGLADPHLFGQEPTDPTRTGTYRWTLRSPLS